MPTSYDIIEKPTTIYSDIAKVSTPYTGSGDIGSDLLQEDGFLILKEDDYKIKFPDNIWTNIPKV